MLTPVYRPDFLALAARLTLQRRFSVGTAEVTTVIIFDDDSSERDFCRSYTDLCDDSSFVRLSLVQLLGVQQYEKARSAISKSGEYSSPAQTHCNPLRPGQTWQGMKKFYGALHGPQHCRHYFVSDAESLPFRPYDWERISAVAVGHHLTAHWHESQTCTGGHNDWGDPACEVAIATQLQLEPPHVRTLRFWEQSDVPNQFWFYSRAFVAGMVSTVEAAMRVPFYRAWLGWRFSDASFYNLWALGTSANSSKSSTDGGENGQQLRNLPAEIEQALPAAHRQCCQCDGRSRVLPCRHARDLVSACMLRAAGASQIASFMIDRLGMFGSWFEVHPLPSSLLDAREENGISWCMNNCFNHGVLRVLMASSSVNSTFAAALEGSALLRSAFEQNKRHG